MSELPHVVMLARLGAGQEHLTWASGFASAQEAWDACERSDWMIWLCEKLGPQNNEGALLHMRLAAACARTGLRFLTVPESIAEMTAIVDGLEALALGQEVDLRLLRQRAATLQASSATAAASFAASAAYEASQSYHRSYLGSLVAAARTESVLAYAAYYAAKNTAVDGPASRQEHRARMAQAIRQVLPCAPGEAS